MKREPVGGRDSLGGGLYRRGNGQLATYWLKAENGEKHSWHRLQAVQLEAARDEALVLLTEEARQRGARLPVLPALRWENVAAEYLKAGCPDKRGRPRRDNMDYMDEQYTQSRNLKKFFASISIADINIPMCHEYAAQRGSPRRAEIELSCLSNILNFAVLRGLIPVNRIVGRGTLRDPAKIRHSRECQPADGNELNRLARELFWSKSQVAAWIFLFGAMTGCRLNELMSLRVDAKAKSNPGWIEGNYLYVRRSKRGVFPFVPLHDDLLEVIAEHRSWHDEVYPDSPWYFPGQHPECHTTRECLSHKLKALCTKLELPPRTSHGLRAYFVTLNRSQGIPDAQVAALIGDKTLSLIENTYGALPEVWAGGKPLSFRPDDDSEPAWRCWRKARAAVEQQAKEFEVEEAA